MTTSDWISITGTLVTLVAMGVSIWQAVSAAKSSRAAQKAMAEIRSAAIADRLRSAQEHIRTLPSVPTDMRGTSASKSKPKVERIRQEFDIVLGALTQGSPARDLVSSAQVSLNQYEESLSATLDRSAWQTLQSSVQDAISELTAAGNKSGDTDD